MITVTNRDFQILTQINYEGDKGLIVLEDEFSQPENSDLSTYNFSFLNTVAGAELVKVGCYVFAQDGDNLRAFEILETQDVDNIRTAYCFDGGLDLINEEKGWWNYETPNPITVYVNDCLFDSGWEIGVNQIPNTRTRKLKYEQSESAVKRLRRVAKDFDAEIEYRFVISEDMLLKRVVDIFQKGTRSKTIVLEYGNEVVGITKTESIQNLCTGIYATGEEGINLIGFEVPAEDREQFTIINGTLINKAATREWGRWKDDINGYILTHFESISKTQKRLYQETKEQLLKRSIPEITFEMDIKYLPEKIRRGYNVAVIAHDFKPAITIEAIVTAIEGVSFVKNNYGIAKVSNVHTINKPPLEIEIESLKNRFNNQVLNWNNAPYQLEIISTNGNVFQNGNISTVLTAKVTKNDVDVTDAITRFEWSRISRYNTTGDGDFIRQGSTITITNSDVDAEARFICKAYINDELKAENQIVIKDFVMSNYRGDTPPVNADSGTIWIDTSVNPEVTKIFDKGTWQNVVTSLDLNSLSDGFENILSPVRERQALLEAELQAKATLNEYEKFRIEFERFMNNVSQNKQTNENALVDLAQRLALQETNFGTFKNQWNFLDGYITFSEEGMAIGSKTSNTSMLVRNGGITIFSNGKEVATFQEGYMKIDNGIFTIAIQIGKKWRIREYELNDNILVFEYLGVV